MFCRCESRHRGARGTSASIGSAGTACLVRNPPRRLTCPAAPRLSGRTGPIALQCINPARGPLPGTYLLRRDPRSPQLQSGAGLWLRQPNPRAELRSRRSGSEAVPVAPQSTAPSAARFPRAAWVVQATTFPSALPDSFYFSFLFLFLVELSRAAGGSNPARLGAGGTRVPLRVLPGLCWLSHAGALRGEALGFLAARAEHDAARSGTAAVTAKSKRRWFRRGRGCRCAGTVPPARAGLQRDEVRVPAQRLLVLRFPSEKRLFCFSEKRCWDALSDTGWFQPLPAPGGGRAGDGPHPAQPAAAGAQPASPAKGLASTLR